MRRPSRCRCASKDGGFTSQVSATNRALASFQIQGALDSTLASIGTREVGSRSPQPAHWAARRWSSSPASLSSFKRWEQAQVAITTHYRGPASRAVIDAGPQAGIMGGGLNAAALRRIRITVGGSLMPALICRAPGG